MTPDWVSFEGVTQEVFACQLFGMLSIDGDVPRDDGVEPAGERILSRETSRKKRAQAYRFCFPHSLISLKYHAKGQACAPELPMIIPARARGFPDLSQN